MMKIVILSKCCACSIKNAPPCSHCLSSKSSKAWGLLLLILFENDDHDEADPWGCDVSCKIVYDKKKINIIRIGIIWILYKLEEQFEMPFDFDAATEDPTWHF